MYEEFSNTALTFSHQIGVPQTTSEAHPSEAEQIPPATSYRYADQRASTSNAISTPASLMAKLMNKACSLLADAALSLQKNDAESFQNTTLHASQIILSLRCLLDYRSNKHLSAEMFLTYTMIATSLRKAREEQDLKAITAINRALNELQTAWHSVA